jgi:hypothetical protein
VSCPKPFSTPCAATAWGRVVRKVVLGGISTKSATSKQPHATPEKPCDTSTQIPPHGQPAACAAGSAFAQMNGTGTIAHASAATTQTARGPCASMAPPKRCWSNAFSSTWIASAAISQR